MKNINKIMFILSLIVSLFLVGCSTSNKVITNFNECAEEIGIISESYPSQCHYDGKTFIQELSIEEKCNLNQGEFIESANECEDISLNVCSDLGGVFNECGSACRNDPNAEFCTMQCVPFCSFNDKNIIKNKKDKNKKDKNNELNETKINISNFNISQNKENLNNKTITTNFKKVKTKLIIPKNDSIYFGAFPDFGGHEDNITIDRIEKFENLINKNITWAYFSQNWFNGITYPKKEIHIINDKGIIPFVRLMPRSNEEQFQKENIFTLEKIIDGKFDYELRKWARDAKKDNIYLLIDFAVEMNGNWFSWSGYYNGGGVKDKYGMYNFPDGPEKYRDAYRHIIDLFRDENVTTVTWFFHPDIYSMPNKEWNEPKYYYPGDDYIDWIGVSIYGPQNPDEDYWETFSEILENRYKSILDISKNKPIALLEFGVTDNHRLGKKNEWLENAFETILDNEYIDFKAISYWHENWEEDDDLFATLRIDSSKESLETFKKYSSNKKFISNAEFSN